MADMEVLAPGGHQHLVDKIKEQLDLKADASLASAVEKVIENQPTAVLSGTVLTASDTYAEPPVTLTVDGKSTQDGTPTPDAPVEIRSVVNPVLTVAGRNLFDKSDIMPNRYINASGGLSAWNAASASDYIPVVPNTSYTLHFGASPGNNRIAFYSQANINGFISPTVSFSSTSVTFTTPDGARFMRFSCYTSVLDSAQLEAGSTATPYAPYVTPTTVTLPVTLRSLPDGTKDTLALSYLRPSTREGWAWYSRELVQRVAAKTFDGTDMSGWSIMPGSYQAYQYIWTEAGSGAYDWTALTASNSRCSNCTFNGISVTTNVIGYSNTNYAMRYRYRDMAGVDARLTDLAAFFADSPVTFTVPMQHSITTTLDPIELPVLPAPGCTVWSDPTTGLQMSYVRDTEIVIDSLNAEIDRAHAAIAPVEHGTSSANYAVGSYLMLDGTFCKVTSAIATGETITIGTNVVATTVDAELASLE